MNCVPFFSDYLGPTLSDSPNGYPTRDNIFIELVEAEPECEKHF